MLRVISNSWRMVLEDNRLWPGIRPCGLCFSPWNLVHPCRSPDRWRHPSANWLASWGCSEKWRDLRRGECCKRSLDKGSGIIWNSMATSDPGGQAHNWTSVVTALHKYDTCQHTRCQCNRNAKMLTEMSITNCVFGFAWNKSYHKETWSKTYARYCIGYIPAKDNSHSAMQTVFAHLNGMHNPDALSAKLICYVLNVSSY